MTGGSEFSELALEARSAFFVEGALVDLLELRIANGQMTEGEGIKALKQLLRGDGLPVEILAAQQMGAEWNTLMDGMKEEAAEWQHIAKSQYRQGFYLLPAAVVLVLGGTIASIHWWNVPARALVLLAAAGLAVLAAHSFFVFRVHQQARIAAERLSEKRAASLFLRLALSRSSPTQAPQILATAAAMFLGHQAPETIPLQPSDMRKKV